jgi:hypothetical protein
MRGLIIFLVLVFPHAPDVEVPFNKYWLLVQPIIAGSTGDRYQPCFIRRVGGCDTFTRYQLGV